MQAQSAIPVRTFSIGFHESGFNEAHHAAEVAAHLGTEHTELYLTAEQSLDVVPKLGSMYDEPFADASQIPTFLVSQLARQKVTVALSGDGGDEVFGGYTRHVWGSRLWERLRRVPAPTRRAFAAALARVPPRSFDAGFRAMSPLIPERLRVARPGLNLRKLVGVMDAGSQTELYESFISTWRRPEQLVIGGNADRVPDVAPDLRLSFAERMMLLDFITYLPNDILAKVDRASMNVSLETRTPYLDPEVIDFAWALPLRMKIRDGKGKWILRELLSRYLPRAMFERPKMGFAVPLGEWLRGPLREWAEELLNERRLREEGFFVVDMVRNTWREHISGAHEWEARLWTVLMFELWLQAVQSAHTGGAS